ncbi:hypothetical protein GFL51_28030 [Rhizobium leguminosarum bv. viciae]|nr:hypothetical protein [Rhizobium leguminosarum bv. viciae]
MLQIPIRTESGGGIGFAENRHPPSGAMLEAKAASCRQWSRPPPNSIPSGISSREPPDCRLLR